MTEDKERMKKHYDLNSKDYNEKMGTGEHGMMHYGDHSDYERSLTEKIISKTGLVSRKEVRESVVNRVKNLAEKADITEQDTVLDSGCGRGGNAVWIAENTGADVIGLDIDEESIEEARRKAEEHGVEERTRFVVGNFDELPVKDFDVYFAIESQCHSEDEEKLLEQVYEALNPGGRLIISDGFRIKRFDAEDEKIAEKMHRGWGVDYLAHIDDFRKYLEDAGFENIRQQHIQDRIRPTSSYLHRLSILSRPYVAARLKLASAAAGFSERTGLGDKNDFEYSRKRYSQLNDLLTTARYQYVAGKQELFAQLDFYAEKPEK
ncbi:SAM-dependent methyltransferase [Candidatus Nanosalina sp. VS9-1]|uniref:SAM-dependent methyltransferase n=1 Tax=Candidatus Nanosalina sp. VS9-1 TaxID=3388566 RepID=UPI0039E05742